MTLSKKVTTLFILFFMLFVLGCSRDKLDPVIRAHLEKPQWIFGKGDKYPSSTYLTGRGVSANLNLAKRQSADELAQTIDDQIQASLNTAGSEQEDNFNQASQQHYSLLDEKTRNYLLQHIRISEIWENPATHAYHVLSTIDRIKVGDEMLSEIYRMDEQIDRILARARQETDVLQRIAFANLAIEKQEQRDKLQAVVEVIKPIAGIADSHWNAEKIRNQISVWLNELKIMPVAQHSEFNLMGAMKEGVISAGMTVHLGAKPDYILKGHFNRGLITWKDGVYSLKGKLQLELLDGEWKGQVRGDVSWPIEVTALERNQLSGKLIDAIKQAHQKKLRDTLLAIEQ